MLNEFLKVAYQHGQQDEASVEMSKMMSSAFSKEELYALATGEVKLAHLCGSNDDQGPASWLERFRDTPLFDQALMLEEEYLQNEQQDLSQRAQDSAMSQTRSQFWQMQDQLRLKKKLLELELEKLQNQATMAPPVDPTAVPMTAATPEPAPEAAQGSGAPQGSMESKVVQASARPQTVLKEKLWKLASAEMDKTAAGPRAPSASKGVKRLNNKTGLDRLKELVTGSHYDKMKDQANTHRKLFGKDPGARFEGMIRQEGAKVHATRAGIGGAVMGAGAGAYGAYQAQKHNKDRAKKEHGQEKDAAFFGMGGNTMGRISALGSRAASAFRPSAAGAVAAKVVPNTIGNLAQNVKSPFGQHQSVEQLFGQMKAMGPKAAPAPMVSPNLSGVDMHQGTMRGAVNKATGAVGGALGRASDAVGGAASSAANAVSGAVGGMADRAKGLFNRLSPTARMQSAYSNTAAQAYPMKFASALSKMAAKAPAALGMFEQAKNLGGHALEHLKANPATAMRLGGGVAGAVAGGLTGQSPYAPPMTAGERLTRMAGGAALGAGAGHVLSGHPGTMGLKDKAMGMKDKLVNLAQTAPIG